MDAGLLCCMRAAVRRGMSNHCSRPWNVPFLCRPSVIRGAYLFMLSERLLCNTNEQ